MGIGMLRRYHARPDEGVITETAMAPQPGGEETEVEKAIVALQRVSALEADLTEKIEAAEADENFDADALEELRQEYLAVSQRVEEAKIELEKVELEAKEKADAADKAAADAKAAEAAKAIEGNPGRNGKKADWEAFALSHGKTAEDIKDLNRDSIAALFLGPKQ